MGKILISVILSRLMYELFPSRVNATEVTNPDNFSSSVLSVNPKTSP